MLLQALNLQFLLSLFNHLFDQSLFSEAIISFFLESCMDFEGHHHDGWGTNDEDCVEVLAEIYLV